MSKPKIAVMLAGCGYLDGAEIQEAVLTTYFLQKNGCETSFFAPDVDQRHVVNHLTGQPTDERRNVLVEAARIARGKIAPLAGLTVVGFDALAMPGGFGAAKNYSDYAVKGRDGSIDPVVAMVIREFHAKGKPILAVCISPVVVALALRDAGVHVTIGDDAATIADLAAFGATHTVCPVEEFQVDEANRIVTSPAYMYGSDAYHVGLGIEAAVAALMKML